MEDIYRPSIKSLPKPDRPRERLVAKGATALSDVELISIIVGKGTKKYPIQILSQRLLSKFHGLKGLLQANLNELLQIDGIGVAKACQLAACFEVSLRNIQRSDSVQKKQEYTNSKVLYNLLRPYILGKEQEILLVVSLDVRNRLIAVDVSTTGTVNESLVHSREIFRSAIQRNASKIVIAHNHPSNDPTPSSQDIMQTKRLVEVSYIIGIPLLDHIVLGAGSYVSLNDAGYLKKEMIQ